MSNKIRVIIADDEILIRNGLALAIHAEADMEVVATSQNGLEAIQKAMESKPDLILMDIQMPIMNGIEAIQRIREVDDHVIILILTTFNEDEYVIEGLATGSQWLFIKESRIYTAPSEHSGCCEWPIFSPCRGCG